jgi:uncharacterized tellurite resistance protein B-like protein
MGFLERFRSTRRQMLAPAPRPERALELTVTIGDQVERISVPVDRGADAAWQIGERTGPASKAADCWVPQGQAVVIGGRRIEGGLIYVGSNLGAVATDYLIEPALIDPALEVASAAGSTAGPPHYWPSYEGLSAEGRGTYLDWLAGPRAGVEADQSHLFLYFYGLERRLLADPGADPAAGGEREALRGEVERLRGEVGVEDAQASFALHAGRLLVFLEAQDLLRGGVLSGPPREQVGWETPPTLRVMLGELAAAKLALPAELAVSWILSSPEAYLRTPAKRCPEEFARLFERRYHERFDAGPSLSLDYRPANRGLEQAAEETGLPDVSGSSRLVEPLRALGRDCSEELDPYSRWLGRNPGGDGIKALALLPAVLLGDADGAELGTLRAMLAEATTDPEPWALDPGGLLDLFSPGAEKLPKKDGVMVLQLLEKLGYGMEPDQRFGGPALRRGEEAILFELGAGDPRTPSPAYATASLMLALLAGVATADGVISPEEDQLLEAQIGGVAELYGGERERLRAQARWLTRTQPKLSGLAKKLAALEPGQREGIARSLVTLAAADGDIAPAEVKVLQRIFGLLGLDPADVYSALHAVSSGSADDGPVVVREGDQALGGEPIPPAPGPAAEPRRGLDRAAIDAKIEETAVVSTLLAGIFVEGDAVVPSAPEGAAGAVARGKLGGALLAFATALSDRPSWSRAEVEALAAEHGLMVDGALESINEAAFEACEEPFSEGEDPIEVDNETAKEIVG